MYIRIYGSLSLPAGVSMQKLYIFFDTVLPFPKKNNETYVTCLNNMNADCTFSYGRYDADVEAY